MELCDYIAALPEKLSPAKSKILTRLWQEGTAFPRGWVLSSELLKITRQKYFDRRVRELRDETGCDIETGTFRGEHAYRLLTSAIKGGNVRKYLSASQKRCLLEASRYTCAVCGYQAAVNGRGIQADHKVPLVRGGDHGAANWQVLCVACNVGKRRACQGCEMNCAECPWAFPDRVGIRLNLILPYEIDGAKTSSIGLSQQQLQELFSQFLSAAIKSRQFGQNC
jgi:5-methylcytosine-specific restriction endonuclease McrA